MNSKDCRKPKQTNKKRKPKRSSAFAQTAFSFQGITEWNKLPVNLKISTDLKEGLLGKPAVSALKDLNCDPWTSSTFDCVQIVIRTDFYCCLLMTLYSDCI